MKKTMNTREFHKWVMHEYLDFLSVIRYEDYKKEISTKLTNCEWKDYIFRSKIYGHYVVCKNKNKFTITNLKTNTYGSSRLHPKDEFEIHTAIAIAWARLKGKIIPKINDNMVKIKELKYGDIFKYNNTTYIFVANHPTKVNHWIVVNNNTTQNLITPLNEFVEKI